MNFLSYEFFQLSLIGALLIGLIAPSVGIYLVQRKMSLIGDGIGHVALTGVAIGFLLKTSPVLTAVLVSAAGAVAIELIRERAKASGDVALAMLFYGGIAGGVVLISLSKQGTNSTLQSYLFGSLNGTSRSDLTAMLVLGAGVLGVTLLGRPWLFAVSQDEEHARVSGLPVRFLNVLLAVTTAVTVTTAMRAVGLLLVSALMVVPVATAQQVTRGFTATLVAAMVIGVTVSGAGVLLAAEVDTPPGAFIVVLAVGLFVLVATFASVLRRRRPVRAPNDTAHTEPPDVVLGPVT
ncbi:metal ABC transporter permease [Longispora urticae]